MNRCRQYLAIGIPLALFLMVSGCSIRVIPPEREPLPKEPVGAYHTVQKGETLWRIARTYRIPVTEIQRANRLPDEHIQADQRLLIPGAQKALKVPPPPAAPELFIPKDPPKPTTDQEPPEIIREPEPGREPADTLFSWPVFGRVLSSPETAERDKQVVVEVPGGKPVQATRNGVIFYQGITRELGNTLVIDHEDGYFSVYGGDIAEALTRDTRVSRGMVVGKMNPDKDTTILILEIRRGTLSLNPFLFLEELP